MSQGPVMAPESAVPLEEPELPELLLELVLPLEPELPLDPELPVDPELPELPLDPELLETPELPVEPELPVDPELLLEPRRAPESTFPELPLGPELPPELDGDPMGASDVLASREGLKLSSLEPQAEKLAVAHRADKRVRARIVNLSFPSLKSLDQSDAARKNRPLIAPP